VAKPNYRHAKKQKEAARKARQDAKRQRRLSSTEEGEAVEGADTAAAPEATELPAPKPLS